DICDGNMQEGSFRCDANVSVRPKGQEKFGTRAEIKNVNSFRFVERAIEYEIERQIELIEGGGRVVQETRLYDPDRDETRSMRGKEEANDYRYFPDPDLLPLVIEDSFIEQLRASLPELPQAAFARFVRDYGLPDYDAATLTAERATAGYYEALVAATGGEARLCAKLCANWVMGDLAAALNRAGLPIGESPVPAEALAGLLGRVLDGTLSGKLAKEVFGAMWAGEGTADAIIAARGLVQLTDSSAIDTLIDGILAASPKQVEQYRAGQDKLFGFFVGQVMKASKGKANPQQVNERLLARLKG
ncbi:MAG TPA: Asp-tRNA(Asn)/Glu-tRNA(Gln) amidotransferase subunit GatB, partial [Plasticicumulans sp.]|nr:Asp-tRNA(Asn)/Glu-tRNA(Gln) amidotransferase subunit GatB [Plasticicumulans sp.]